MRAGSTLVAVGLELFVLICAYDVAWMKASDYGVLPRNIEGRYELVKLLLFWIPLAMCAVASYLAIRLGLWAMYPSALQHSVLTTAFVGLSLALPIIAWFCLWMLGCFVFYTYFEACI